MIEGWWSIHQVHTKLIHVYMWRNLKTKRSPRVRERPFHYLGGAGRVVFSRLFFHLMFKAGFFFHTPVEARFFFHKELKVRLFFYSHVSSQRYSHYFQGWGKIIFFATYQSKKIFSTYRLGQIIFFGQKQRQIIFSKTLPAPPPR